MDEKLYTAQHLEPEYLEAIRGTALFYPCSGRDTDVPLRMFASTLSSLYFVDKEYPSSRSFTRYLDGHRCRLHRWRRRGEEVLDELPPLGVFYYRGDNLVNGEGSSGVPWLGVRLFSRILDLLVPYGLVVTDGANQDRGGPAHLSDFFQNRTIGPAAVSAAVPFNYQGRSFRCVGYGGERYGPTLIWQVAPY